MGFSAHSKLNATRKALLVAARLGSPSGGERNCDSDSGGERDAGRPWWRWARVAGRRQRYLRQLGGAAPVSSGSERSGLSGGERDGPRGGERDDHS